MPGRGRPALGCPDGSALEQTRVSGPRQSAARAYRDQPAHQQVAKSLPLDDFHHDVELTVALAGVVDRDVAGWFSADASLASCSKRLMAAAVEAALMLRTLMATLRASFGSQAR